jgi:hypothetical protein
MPSDVQIANAALLRIGEKAITSFTDPGKAGLIVNNTYAIHRDALMRAIPWRFAIWRTSIAASTTEPAWEFESYFPLPEAPNYCLRVLTIENVSDRDWRLEGRMIVTSVEAPIYLKYIRRVEDPNNFDSLFVETFIAKLQWEWAENLVKDASLSAALLTEYVGKRDEAGYVTESEGKMEPRPAGTWFEAHFR